MLTLEFVAQGIRFCVAYPDGENTLPAWVRVGDRVFEPRDQHEREVRRLSNECAQLSQDLQDANKEGDRLRRDNAALTRLLFDGGVSWTAREAVIGQHHVEVADLQRRLKEAIGTRDSWHRAFSDEHECARGLLRERDEARAEIARRDAKAEADRVVSECILSDPKMVNTVMLYALGAVSLETHRAALAAKDAEIAQVKAVAEEMGRVDQQLARELDTVRARREKAQQRATAAEGRASMAESQGKAVQQELDFERRFRVAMQSALSFLGYERMPNDKEGFVVAHRTQRDIIHIPDDQQQLVWRDNRPVRFAYSCQVDLSAPGAPGLPGRPPGPPPHGNAEPR